MYAVQCGKCFKWRKIQTQEEFEVIRANVTKDPFVCNKKFKVKCDDPAEIEYDSSRTWVLDKPDVPKTPLGFHRDVILRKDFSKMDVHYTSPEGKRLRSLVEVATFLEENPKYKDSISVEDFSFTTPKVVPETVPKDFVSKLSAEKKIVKHSGKMFLKSP
ncbi:hypothetical protein AG4045_018331 [Apium graveolens]|uniref:MBD domain-containing protein n=2 Tax=Apium graveolens TaxID=4045 RepID=A0A6L5BCQ9_APIGR|nr:hypothetical protein AG4045_018331 [Apium graveolens]